MIRWLLFLVWFASPAVAATAGGEASSLDRLAGAVLAQARAEKVEGPIGIFVRGESALSRAFSTALIAKVSAENLGGVPIDASDFASAEARARKIGARSLIRIELSLSDQKLRAEGDQISTWVNFWSGNVPTRAPRPATIIDLAVPADAMALAIAGSRPGPERTSDASGALRLAVDKFASLPAPLVGLAVGDIDGDGVPEVVALTEDELVAFDRWGRILAQKSLDEIPASAIRCREPFGSLVVFEAADPRSAGGASRLGYRSANRAQAEIVAFDPAASKFRALESRNDAPLGNWQGKLLSGIPLPGHNVFASTLLLNGNRFLDLKRPFQTFSTFAGAGNNAWLITFSDGTASLYQHGLDSAPTQRFSGLGAAAVLVDLKGEGPALASTAPEYNPEQDQLRVWAVGKNSPPLGTISLGPGKAWYAARLSTKTGPDRIVIGIWRPDGTTDLLQVHAQP